MRSTMRTSTRITSGCGETKRSLALQIYPNRYTCFKHTSRAATKAAPHCAREACVRLWRWSMRAAGTNRAQCTWQQMTCGTRMLLDGRARPLER
jgi:hypothetical protein